MNWRLLQPYEKDENRRNRGRRKAARQAHERRQNLLHGLALMAGPGTDIITSLLSPEEVLDLLTGHLNRSRFIAARVRRALRLARIQPTESSARPVEPAPPRPSRVLRAQNCGRVWPVLLANAIDANQPMTIAEAMKAITRHAEDGASPHVLLDFCVRVSGLPWETSAEILHERRIIPGAFAPADILAIRRARAFWDGFHEARVAYAMAVSAAEIPLMRGNWTLFEAAQLHTILPGLRLPTLLRRTAYVVNLVSEPRGLCLDFYSFPSLLPLVRHPL